MATLDMVFEGGGAKGMAFVGAARAIEALGHEPQRLVGTSAGAITATLLAAGYDAKAMEAALGESDARGGPIFASFMDAPERDDFKPEDIERSLTMKMLAGMDLRFVPDALESQIRERMVEHLMASGTYRTLFSFVERGGLYTGQAFTAWMARKLDAKKLGASAMTLGEFFADTGRDLSLVVTDTTAQKLLVLNHRTAPGCPVVQAVRMSMSIPFAWQEVRWQASWGPYQLLDATGKALEETRDVSGHTIVDGGALSNFPIDLLLSDEPHVRAVMGDTDPDASPTLGLLIDEEREVAGAPPPREGGEANEDALRGDLAKVRTVGRVRRLMDTMMKAHDQRLIAVHEDVVCRLPARGYGTMEFDMSDARRQALVDAGQAAMQAHLASRADLRP